MSKMTDEWFANAMKWSEGDPEVDQNVRHFDAALFNDLDNALDEDDRSDAAEEPVPEHPVPRQGAHVAASIEERDRFGTSPAKRFLSPEPGPSEPRRRLFDSSNSDFLLAKQMEAEEDDDYPLRDNPLWLMRTGSKTLTSTDDSSKVRSAYRSFVTDSGGTDEKYESVGIGNLDAAKIMSEMLEDSSDIKSTGGIVVDSLVMTNIELREPEAEPAIRAEPAIQAKPENEPEIEADEVENDRPSDGPPELDGSLSNIMIVFQAIYYHHRTLGGALDTVFRMRDVKKMYPEIDDPMRRGHGLIPGKLTKSPHGVIEHVEKGRGSYRMTETGIAKATEKGW